MFTGRKFTVINLPVYLLVSAFGIQPAKPGCETNKRAEILPEEHVHADAFLVEFARFSTFDDRFSLFDDRGSTDRSIRRSDETISITYAHFARGTRSGEKKAR